MWKAFASLDALIGYHPAPASRNPRDLCPIPRNPDQRFPQRQRDQQKTQRRALSSERCLAHTAYGAEPSRMGYTKRRERWVCITAVCVITQTRSPFHITQCNCVYIHYGTTVIYIMECVVSAYLAWVFDLLVLSLDNGLGMCDIESSPHGDTQHTGVASNGAHTTMGELHNG